MTNTSVITRIDELLDRYESGRATVWDVESQFEMHLTALEGLSSRQVDQARDLVHRLVLASMEETPSAAPAEALDHLRSFVRDLPR